MNSTLQIEIDGVMITGRIDGISSFSVSQSVDEEDRVIKATFSNELTFYDDGYNIIKAGLIDDPIGFSKELPVRVFDDLCGKVVFEGVIKGDALDWCEPDCSVRCNLMQDDFVGSCLQNKMIWDNSHGFISEYIQYNQIGINIKKEYYKLRYCIVHRPLFLHFVVTVIASLLEAIVNIVQAIVFGVLFVVSLGSFSWSDAQQSFGKIKSFLNTCGKFHPTPFVREYIQNVCKVCGISGFDSSILNDQSSHYYNTLLFAAQIEKGREKTYPHGYLITDNLPVETLHTLMRDYLKPLFNADYRVINNRLVFERRDYFYNNTAVWVNTQDLLTEGRLIKDQVCYSWIDKKRYSYGDFSYAEDAIEYLGNEARGRWEDIVEWNPPAYPAGQTYSSAQKSANEVSLQCSPARFESDGLKDLDGVIPDNAPNNGSNYQTLVLAQQTAMNYKFLIADTSNNKGRIKTGYDDNFCGTGNGLPPASERYNYPFWFKEGIQGVYGYQNNLYSLFHYINNPRWPGNTRWNYEFKFQFTCDELDSFDFSKSIQLVKNGQLVTGIITSVTFDFINHVATVKGEI